MLDKTIPYHRVIMSRKTGSSIPSPMLPEGFSFRLFPLGDEYEQAIAALKQALRPSCLAHILTEDPTHA